MKYEDRSLEIQIKIDQLMRFYPYPKAYYETKTNAELLSFHQSKVGEMGKLTIDSLLYEPSSTQLTLF